MEDIYLEWRGILESEEQLKYFLMDNLIGRKPGSKMIHVRMNKENRDRLNSILEAEMNKFIIVGDSLSISYDIKRYRDIAGHTIIFFDFENIDKTYF